MGVTKGGILVPRPFGYDWELFNAAMDPAGQPQTFLQSAGTAFAYIRTRIPQNADIDDLDYLYMYLRSSGTPEWAVVIVSSSSGMISNVSIPPGSIGATWTAYRFPLSKLIPITPGEFISLEVRAGGLLHVVDIRTYQKGAFFSGASVGQTIPFSDDSVTTPPANTPAVFLTWQDADANVITEWMPGLLPMVDRGLVTSSRNFCGNTITMPFTDRRPSGLWFYSAAPGGVDRTIRIYAEPTGPTDLTELYSLTFAAPSGTHKMIYVPFGVDAPRFVQGSRYVVGLDIVTPATPDMFWHQWMRDGAPSPAWTVDPVHLGFDNMVDFASIVSGSWDYTPAGYHCELGLVFEESET